MIDLSKKILIEQPSGEGGWYKTILLVLHSLGITEVVLREEHARTLHQKYGSGARLVALGDKDEDSVTLHVLPREEAEFIVTSLGGEFYKAPQEGSREGPNH